MTDYSASHPCHYCSKPISDLLSYSTCEICTRIWSNAYDEGIKFALEYPNEAKIFLEKQERPGDRHR